jgi:hypothetical protein
MVEKVRQRENEKLIRKIQEEAQESESGVVQDADTVLAALNGDVGARQVRIDAARRDLPTPPLTRTLRQYLIHKQQQEKAQQRQHEYEEGLAAAARPKIDERSRQIQRPGDVSSRLYTHRHKQQHDMQKLQHRKAVESKYVRERERSSLAHTFAQQPPSLVRPERAEFAGERSKTLILFCERSRRE